MCLVDIGLIACSFDPCVIHVCSMFEHVCLMLLNVCVILVHIYDMLAHVVIVRCVDILCLWKCSTIYARIGYDWLWRYVFIVVVF